MERSSNIIISLHRKKFSIITNIPLIIMVALWNRADHYISCCDLFFLLSSFFPHLISAAADWMSAILPHIVWP